MAVGTQQCRVCEGKGTQNLKVHYVTETFGHEAGTWEETEIPCVWCGGSGQMTRETAEELEWNKTAWCRCEDPTIYRTQFYDDGGHEGCPVQKHHYHCQGCGKITQIG